MLSKTQVMVCIAAAVLCVAPSAVAKAVKVELMPYPQAAPLEPDASGHAILNYAKGDEKTVSTMFVGPKRGHTVTKQTSCWPFQHR